MRARAVSVPDDVAKCSEITRMRAESVLNNCNHPARFQKKLNSEALSRHFQFWARGPEYFEMADNTSSFDSAYSRTMESIVVEDTSLNQSQAKECTSTGSRPAPTMVPVVFDKDTTSGKKEGELTLFVRYFDWYRLVIMPFILK